VCILVCAIGVTSEASSLAGHLGLGKLIVCYDDNHITIDGDTEVSFTEDVCARYEAYNWHVQTVGDVNDLAAVRHAIDAAKKVTDKPSMIKIRTVIGAGRYEHLSLQHGRRKVSLWMLPCLSVVKRRVLRVFMALRWVPLTWPM
jgi:transketolase